MTTIPFAERPSCTIEEACRATGLGRTKLYEEMAAGRVQTTDVGKRRLVLVPPRRGWWALGPNPGITVPRASRGENDEHRRHAAGG